MNRQPLRSHSVLSVGAKSALATLAVTGPAVYLAHTFSATFRRSLGVSGKTALITTPVMFMFSLSAELEMGACTAENTTLNIDSGLK